MANNASWQSPRNQMEQIFYNENRNIFGILIKIMAS